MSDYRLMIDLPTQDLIEIGKRFWLNHQAHIDSPEFQKKREDQSIEIVRDVRRMKVKEDIDMELELRVQAASGKCTQDCKGKLVEANNQTLECEKCGYKWKLLRPVNTIPFRKEKK